jgi:hypothetical protein
MITLISTPERVFGENRSSSPHGLPEIDSLRHPDQLNLSGRHTLSPVPCPRSPVAHPSSTVNGPSSTVNGPSSILHFTAITNQHSKIINQKSTIQNPLSVIILLSISAVQSSTLTTEYHP